MQIELTRDEYENLLLTLGMATGVLFAQGEKAAGYRVLKLANAVGRASPNFKPYEIPAEVDGVKV